MATTGIRLQISKDELIEFALSKFEERGISISGLELIKNQRAIINGGEVTVPGIDVQPFWDLYGITTDERINALEDQASIGWVEITVYPGTIK